MRDILSIFRRAKSGIRAALLTVALLTIAGTPVTVMAESCFSQKLETGVTGVATPQTMSPDERTVILKNNCPVTVRAALCVRTVGVTEPYINPDILIPVGISITAYTTSGGGKVDYNVSWCGVKRSTGTCTLTVPGC